MVKGRDKVIKITFDDYKDSYKEQVQKSIEFIGQNVDFFTEVKARYIIKTVRKYLGNPEPLCVLDVGCGVGLGDYFLAPQFGRLHGVDISEGMISAAVNTNPSVHYQTYNGKRLPFADNSMDVVFAVCVMHHIAPAQWPNMLLEFKRVIKKGGLALIFEHNPFNPLTNRVVKNCEFDIDAVLLKQSKTGALIRNAGLKVVESSYILFFPFRGRVLFYLDRLLRWLPLGAQYYVVGRKS